MEPWMSNRLILVALQWLQLDLPPPTPLKRLPAVERLKLRDAHPTPKPSKLFDLEVVAIKGLLDGDGPRVVAPIVN